MKLQRYPGRKAPKSAPLKLEHGQTRVRQQKSPELLNEILATDGGCTSHLEMYPEKKPGTILSFGSHRERLMQPASPELRSFQMQTVKSREVNAGNSRIAIRKSISYL